MIHCYLWVQLVAASLATVILLDTVSNDSFSVQGLTATPDGFQEYTLSKREKLNPATMKYICRYNPKAILRFKDTGTVMVPDESAWLVVAKRYAYYEVDTEQNKEDKKVAENAGTAKNSPAKSPESPPSTSTIDSPHSVPLFPASNCVQVTNSDGSSGSVSLGYALKLLVAPYTDLGTKWVVSTLAFRFGGRFPTSTTRGQWSGTHTCVGQKGTSTRLMFRPPVQSLHASGRRISFSLRTSKLDQEEQWEQLTPVKMLMDQMPIFYCMNWPGRYCGEAQTEFTDTEGVRYVVEMET